YDIHIDVMVTVAYTNKVLEPRDRFAAHRVHKLNTGIIKERYEINHVLVCDSVQKDIGRILTRGIHVGIDVHTKMERCNPSLFLFLCLTVIINHA
ncbi:MAG: hypothetical protein M3M87_05310, partial [Thermoproteota archaeon]|nr:hypothetical protein [Thermoproteota archaeon]